MRKTFLFTFYKNGSKIHLYVCLTVPILYQNECSLNMDIRSIIKKYLNRETVLYLLFGVMTTIINFVVYRLCRMAGIVFWLSNIIAWVAAVAAAFVTNKLWAFESKSWAPEIVWRELGLFVSARLLSLGVEEGFLLLTVGLLHAPDMPMKVIAAVFVVIINYIFSKFIIFRKGNNDEQDKEQETF